jgi:hypothetical protein
MSIPFLCSNITDVCSFGIIPNIQCLHQPTIGDSCVCQGPWQHDFMWAHLPNCMMPSQLPLAMCIISFILSAILVPMFIKLKLRSSAKQIQIYTIITLVGTPFLLLAMYLQGGVYEIALVLMIPMQCLLGLLNATLVEIILKPLLKVKSIARVHILMSRIRKFKYSCVPVFTVMKLVQIPFAQDTNVQIYNAIWVADMFIQFTFFTLFNTVIYFSVPQLQKSINKMISNVGDMVENSPNNYKYVDVSKRLQKLKTVSAMTTFTTLLPMFLVAVIFTTLGYFPMLGVFFYSMIASSYGGAVVLKSSLESQKFNAVPSETLPITSPKSSNKDEQRMVVAVNGDEG